MSSRIETIIFVNTSLYDPLSDKQNFRTEKESDHPKLIIYGTLRWMETCDELLSHEWIVQTFVFLGT